MNEIRTYFGRNLKRIRKLKGLPQELLAEKTGLERRQITRIETGKSFPSFRTLDSLCCALDVSPSELFNFSEIAASAPQAEVNDNDIILNSIKAKLEEHKTSLPKLKFIHSAVLCLENKSYITKLQNILEGMLI